MKKIIINDIYKKRAVKFIALWFISFILLISLLIVDLFNGLNYLEVFPSELLFPITIHFLSASIITLFVYFMPIPKRFVGKLISVILLTFMIVGYQDRLNGIASIYRVILPVLPKSGQDIPIISGIFIITIGAIAIIVGAYVAKLLKHKPQKLSFNIVLAISITVGFIFATQILRLANTLPAIIKESKAQPLIINGQGPGVITEKPDIYYIVLDRYTNSEVLKNQFSYNNQEFTSFLKNEGFVVNKDAYSNYPTTTASISSTINADYTNKIVEKYTNEKVQTRTLYHNLIRQSSVIKALKDNGYKYYHIGSTYGASNKAPLADADLVYSSSISIAGKINKRLRSFESAQFNNSPYQSFANVSLSWWPLKLEQTTNDGYVYKQLNKLNDLASHDPGGRFIFAHILVPHDPFTFNSDGSISTNPGTDNYGKPIKIKYTNQVEYISDQIKLVIEKINQRTNKNAVIILNADEGPFPWDINKTLGQGSEQQVDVNETDMTKLPNDWLKMKFGILQAVQIPKMNNKDKDNISSVNIFRIVLNNYLNYKLNYLPYCAFAFDKGFNYEYKYKDITSKLVPDYDSEYCSQLQTSN